MDYAIWANPSPLPWKSSLTVKLELDPKSFEIRMTPRKFWTSPKTLTSNHPQKQGAWDFNAYWYRQKKLYYEQEKWHVSLRGCVVLYSFIPKILHNEMLHHIQLRGDTIRSLKECSSRSKPHGTSHMRSWTLYVAKKTSEIKFWVREERDGRAWGDWICIPLAWKSQQDLVFGHQTLRCVLFPNPKPKNEC